MKAGKGLREILLKNIDIVYSLIFVDVKEIPKVQVAIVKRGVSTRTKIELFFQKLF